MYFRIGSLSYCCIFVEAIVTFLILAFFLPLDEHLPSTKRRDVLSKTSERDSMRVEGE
jgi:hypothetical protein